MRSEPQAQELVNLYGMVRRMRVQSSPQTIACAEAVIRAIIDSYLAPNMTLADLFAAMQSGEETMDPLKGFAEAAREELGSLRYLQGDARQESAVLSRGERCTQVSDLKPISARSWSASPATGAARRNDVANGPLGGG